MASLKEMTDAGYGPQAPQDDVATQMVRLLSGIDAEAQKKQEKEKADVMDQVKLFSTLRENGYSKEAAHERVTRTYRSTNFIENLLRGDTNAFTPPTEVDKTQESRDKAAADLEKTKADTGLIKAKEGYYKEGGPKRTVIDTMTPNQLQSRLKYLSQVSNTAEVGSEEEQTAKAEMETINQKLQKLTGYAAPAEGAPDEAAAAPASQAPQTFRRPERMVLSKKYKIGDWVMYKGQKKQIKKVDQSGKLYF